MFGDLLFSSVNKTSMCTTQKIHVVAPCFPSSEGQSAMRIVLEEHEPTQANQCDHTLVEIGDFTPRPSWDILGQFQFMSIGTKTV